MHIALRPAHRDDFEFCARLYFSGMEETIRQLKLDMAAQTTNLRNLWKPAEVEIITCDGTDIGWVQVSLQDDTLFLGQIFVEAAYQRRGIGTEIITGLIDEANQTGRPITLGVVKSDPARSLYERLGFRITDEDNRKFYMRR